MTSPQTGQATRRLADFIREQVQQASQTGVPQYATVTSVGAAGSGFDGVNAALFVRWAGQVVQCRYLNSYTPQVNDRVELGYDGSQLVARGRVIG